MGDVAELLSPIWKTPIISRIPSFSSAHSLPLQAISPYLSNCQDKIISSISTYSNSVRLEFTGAGSLSELSALVLGCLSISMPLLTVPCALQNTSDAALSQGKRDEAQVLA